MNITDYADYITGKKFTDKKIKEPRRMDAKTYKELFEEISTQLAFNENIIRINTPAKFFEAYPQIADMLPKAIQEEAFYALKIQKFSPVVPAKVLYALEQCEEAGSFNLFTKYFTAAQLQVIFAKGYFGDGVCLQDIIRSQYQRSFEPVEEFKLVVDNKDPKFKDVYVKDTDMIAIVPKEVIERLSMDDIKNLKVVKKQLVIGGMSLLQVGGFYGVSNSTYDLRNAR